MLGTVDYADALALQERIVAARIAGQIGDTLLLLEHPAVITIGKHADRRHVLANDEELVRRGITVVNTTRGGDVTYHGPGQLVAYPIVNLRGLGLGIRDYIHGLEQCVIQLLGDEYGVDGAVGSDQFPGVWIGQAKVAAVGVAVKRAVTYHGIALNGSVDLTAFNLITPCGISGRAVTSIAQLTGAPVSPDQLTSQFAEHFSTQFGCSPVPAVLESLVGHHSEEDRRGKQ